MKKKNLYQVSEVKLTYVSKIRASERPQIRTSQDAYNVFLNNWGDQIELVEECNMLLLNRNNRVIGMFNVSRGGVSGTVVDAKIIFAAALKGLACSIIICHNHPSHSIQPSKTDIDLTKKLQKAGEALDIAVVDHLIITPYSYCSLADEGLI